jgi:peptidoglycan/xylan/chitin deacetylase (PgdA/CDA1 family)
MSIFTCIPAMMYHHVNREPEDSISISPENFEIQIKYLAEAGYRSLHLPEFFSYLESWNIPEKLVLITFDDGYVDNYLFAYPILKKYNMKATIFPITAFIKDKIVKRGALMPNFELLMRTPVTKGGLDDFLSWEEMKEMEKSGLIDIQAHSHSHAAYFEGERILSFYDGGMNTKIGWATDGDTRPGIPIYPSGPSLCARRYFDDKELRDKLAGYVEKHGGGDFMLKPGAITELKDIVKKHGRLNGRFETEADSESRIMHEMTLTKELIEIKLNKKVDYICWPWGSVDKKLISRAKRAGFIGGIGMKGGANMRLTDVMDIHRFNPCKKDIPALKQKLHKHSNLLLSLYNDKRIDNILIGRKKFL